MSQLRVEQVSFATGKLAKGGTIPRGAYLLRGISFTVNHGDRIALLGASGAGKTTLLRLLNRLADPVQGTLYFEDKPFSQISSVELRQKIALVPQEPKLLGMTVQEALLYPLQLRNVPAKAAEAQMQEWRDRAQIPSEWLTRGESQLSLGERQLVAIVRALICQPTILLLDEPTAAIDANRSAQLLTLLEHLPQTILMATHQLNLAERFTQQVLYLERGEIIEQGESDRVNWQRLRGAIAKIETEDAEDWD